MNKSLPRLLKTLTPRVVLAVASACAALSLFSMLLPLVTHSPLLLIASISVAHALGLTGVLLFGVSVLLEVVTRPKPSGKT